MTKSRNIQQPRRQWTAHEIAMLHAHYPHQVTTDLATMLGIDVKLIYSKAMKLGLRKSAAFLATDKSGRILKGGVLGQAHQFQPGQQPWNAGTHYVAGGRSAQTRFKPGNKPHTTMPIGSYRVCAGKQGPGHEQLERKTSEASGGNHKRWTPVARLVWGAAHGPVPRGSIVVFRPGLRTVVLEEITLERIECITRAEHAKRNHPRSHSPELGRLLQLKGVITRQVNRIAREHEQHQTQTHAESPAP